MQEIIDLRFSNLIWAFILPLVLMVLDVVTGYLNAWKSKKVSSKKMRDGLGKKCAELCYIVLGFLFKYAFNLSAVLYFLTFYVCYMEIISLSENCTKLGVPLPLLIKEKLKDYQDILETKNE